MGVNIGDLLATYLLLLYISIFSLSIIYLFQQSQLIRGKEGSNSSSPPIVPQRSGTWYQSSPFQLLAVTALLAATPSTSTNTTNTNTTAPELG